MDLACCICPGPAEPCDSSQDRQQNKLKACLEKEALGEWGLRVI